MGVGSDNGRISETDALDWAGRVGRYFHARGWQPFDFQRRTWRAMEAGKSGIVHAPTGVGKTLAVWLGALGVLERMAASGQGLRVLWVTPLRALAADTARALQEAVDGMDLPYDVALRTGDTPARQRRKLKSRLPTCLVTTPESLSLFLSYPETRERFKGLQVVVVDEWHELIGGKRGVQTELALARLRAWRGGALRICGVSATVGDRAAAMEALLGPGGDGVWIDSDLRKELVIETLVPEQMERFPWSGHLGLRQTGEVIEALAAAKSSLVFTNTRAQAENWFHAIRQACPHWENEIALHHGSLDKAARREVEAAIAAGKLRAVVATSSLDLGVDFPPVDQVIQIGGPKGIARLRQRAGRSGHQPGLPSRLVCVPTHALELMEFAAAREAMAAGWIERRQLLLQPMDVLVQHLVTVALGGGFNAMRMYDEVRSTAAFAGLSEAAWEWALRFVVDGGRALGAYPQFRKVRVRPDDGWHYMEEGPAARLHRSQIGTITGNAAVEVRMAGGRRLGTVEEWFATRLAPGACFLFAGRMLELVRHRDLTMWVRPARPRASLDVPSWQGGRMPLSSELASAALGLLGQSADRSPHAEMRALGPLLATQRACSRIPGADFLLVERTRTREGVHLFFFPFAGRLAHEGMAALVAHRLARLRPATIQITVDDYGFALQSRQGMEIDERECRGLFSPENLAADIEQCLNTTEMARHHFRETARIAGLALQAGPAAAKSRRALQASSTLIFDTLAAYEPDHLLLEQARREILDSQLEISRLESCLRDLSARPIHLVETPHLSPFAFPLWAGRLAARLSTEDWQSRLSAMLARLEA